jgi:hypothetical protein
MICDKYRGKNTGPQSVNLAADEWMNASLFLFSVFPRVGGMILVCNFDAFLTKETTVKLGYKFMKGTEYFVSLLTSIILSECYG